MCTAVVCNSRVKSFALAPGTFCRVGKTKVRVLKITPGSVRKSI